MAERKTERVIVWLRPEQVEWLKTKKNVSEAVRAMVAEAMSMDALAQSVKPVRPKNAAAPAATKATVNATTAKATAKARAATAKKAAKKKK